jgi:hypothetical protein
MTFEDFKKQSEIFTKINTPEELAFLECQYQNHISHLENENYFEPFESKMGTDIISQYNQNLLAIFNFNEIKENQIFFLVIPSFEPENLLIFERQKAKYLVTHISLDDSYWTLFYKNSKIIDIKKSIFTYELNMIIGDKIFALVNKMFKEARKPKAGMFVLDGVVYMLSKKENSEQKTVFKHSPNEDSKSGNFISTLERFIEYKQILTDTFLTQIEIKIDEQLG